MAAVSVARHDRALSTTALFGWAALVWRGATLTGALEVVAAIDLRKLVEGERQLAWGNLIEREMMGVR